MQVSQKIKNAAKKLDMPFNNASEIYALERLVARLNSDRILAESLTYKGGFVLFKTSGTDRYTRDVDATASSVAKNVLIKHLEACWKKKLEDGIVFGNPEITDLTIETGDYGGVRLNLKYQLDVDHLEEKKLHKLPRVHLDVGIGESTHAAKVIPLNPLLESQEEFSWKVLPLEYIFAEKFQTLVLRGDQNSRAKDVYDMSILAKEIESFDSLHSAISEVFESRSTDVPGSFQAFFSSLKLDVLRKSWVSVKLKVPADFDHTIAELENFLRQLDENAQ